MNREQTRNAEGGTRSRADRLRSLNPPHRVAVEVDAKGQPIGMRDVGCEMRRPVEAVGEVWRIEYEWWRQPISRRCGEGGFEVGGTAVLFEVLTTGAWSMHDP